MIDDHFILHIVTLYMCPKGFRLLPISKAIFLLLQIPKDVLKNAIEAIVHNKRVILHPPIRE